MERWNASQTIQEAKKLEKDKDYNSAVIRYNEGIEQLQGVLEGAKSPSEKEIIQRIIDENKKNLCDVQIILERQGGEGRVACIRITDGAIGYSYGSLFGEYLNKTVEKIEIEDPYIRASHQVMNLVKLCELLIHKTSVRYINILTTRDVGEKEKDQLIRLSDLKSDLSSHGITLEYRFSETLHDREIRLDNGWVIKIGRGLDYFKPMKSQFQIGFCDMDLRPCQATTIEIYNSKHVLT